MTRAHRQYHHGDLRAAVLRRAEETLRESGADGLSLRQLARDIGVSHGAPSRHFRDKQALLDALAADGFDRLGSALGKAGAEASGFDVRLRSLARAYLRFAIENPVLLGLMFTRKHSAGPEIAEAVVRAFEVPYALIVEAQRRGEVVPGDPQRIGMAAMAAIQGLATFVGSGFLGEEATDELLDEAISHLSRGLRPRS